MSKHNKFAIVAIVIIVLFFAIMEVAHAQDEPTTVLPPGSFMPLVPGCERIQGEIDGFPHETIIARLDGEKSIVYYRDISHYGTINLRQDSLCFHAGSWCNAYQGCTVQIIIDDPLISRCWKSPVLEDYRGQRMNVLLSKYSQEPCLSDVVLP